MKDSPDVTEAIIVSSLERFMQHFGNLLTRAKASTIWLPNWERYVTLVGWEVMSFNARWKSYTKDLTHQQSRDSIFRSIPSILQSTALMDNGNMTISLNINEDVVSVSCRATMSMTAMSEEILIHFIQLSTAIIERRVSFAAVAKGLKYEVIMPLESWITGCRLRKVCRKLRQLHQHYFKDVLIRLPPRVLD